MENARRFDLICDPVHVIFNIFKNKNIVNVYLKVFVVYY
jgi:hypothetical protein